MSCFSLFSVYLDMDQCMRYWYLTHMGGQRRLRQAHAFAQTRQIQKMYERRLKLRPIIILLFPLYSSVCIF